MEEQLRLEDGQAKLKEAYPQEKTEQESASYELERQRKAAAVKQERLRLIPLQDALVKACEASDETKRTARVSLENEVMGCSEVRKSSECGKGVQTSPALIQSLLPRCKVMALTRMWLTDAPVYDHTEMSGSTSLSPSRKTESISTKQRGLSP